MAKKPVILIDPGHGGIHPDTGQYVTPGKRSPVWPDMPQIFEGVYNRDIALRLARLLDRSGIPYRFIVHPDDWRDVPLSERSRRANEYARTFGRTFYLSIHANGHTSPGANGLETFSYSGSGDSDVYSRAFFDQLAAALPELRKRGAKKADFHVLRETVMPSVLVELGFMTSPGDARHMNRGEFRQRAAAALHRTLRAITGTSGGGIATGAVVVGLLVLTGLSLIFLS